jgi:hypothetical protein
MDKLGVYAPTLVGIAGFVYIVFVARRVRREQARSRQTTAAAE